MAAKTELLEKKHDDVDAVIGKVNLCEKGKTMKL